MCIFKCNIFNTNTCSVNLIVEKRLLIGPGLSAAHISGSKTLPGIITIIMLHHFNLPEFRVSGITGDIGYYTIVLIKKNIVEYKLKS